jgi:hypothetical protein
VEQGGGGISSRSGHHRNRSRDLRSNQTGRAREA